jgi:hypothetical protein
LLPTEFEQTLAGHRYLLAFGSCGCRSTGYSAYARADGSALSPARVSTNERSESRAANDFLSGLTTMTPDLVRPLVTYDRADVAGFG